MTALDELKSEMDAAWAAWVAAAADDPVVDAALAARAAALNAACDRYHACNDAARLATVEAERDAAIAAQEQEPNDD
jgi:hypothetical protein